MNIDQQAFSIWLFSQPPERVINAACNRCFVGSFLREVVCLERAEFGWSEWSPSGGELGLPLPEWVLTLINRKAILELGKGDYTVSCGQMQQRYRELFPTPEPSALRTIIAEALKPVDL